MSKNKGKLFALHSMPLEVFKVSFGYMGLELQVWRFLWVKVTTSLKLILSPGVYKDYKLFSYSAEFTLGEMS